MQSHPNIFVVVLIVTIRKTFSYLHHLKNLRMDLMQNLNQWQSLPMTDLPLIYNPIIKSIQTKNKNKKKNRSLTFGANAEQDIIFSYFICAHTVQLKGKEERFIFYHFQENMILSLPVECDKHDCY